MIAAAAFAAGFWLRPSTTVTDAIAWRLPVVNAHLADMPGGYIFLAGDSHIELANISRFCGRPAVNAGLSGATAERYRGFLQQMRFPTRPGLAVLTIGTNDVLRKKTVRGAPAAERFEREVLQLLGMLKAQAPEVVVTAIPPVGGSMASFIDPEAIRAYSKRLEALCAREKGCRFVDPFSILRESDSGAALPGAMRDELHLSSYRSAFERLEKAVCPSGSL